MSKAERTSIRGVDLDLGVAFDRVLDWECSR